jgi:hypothetical protein
MFLTAGAVLSATDTDGQKTTHRSPELRRAREPQQRLRQQATSRNSPSAAMRVFKIDALLAAVTSIATTVEPQEAWLGTGALQPKR